MARAVECSERESSLGPCTRPMAKRNAGNSSRLRRRSPFGSRLEQLSLHVYSFARQERSADADRLPRLELHAAEWWSTRPHSPYRVAQAVLPHIPQWFDKPALPWPAMEIAADCGRRNAERALRVRPKCYAGVALVLESRGSTVLFVAFEWIRIPYRCWRATIESKCFRRPKQ
jgi:hypothetical protein